MNCKNCGEKVEGNYCSNCGQRSSVSKITISSLALELSNNVFQIDRGFFYTVRTLFTRPGIAIKEYLDGKRIKHFKPITYLLTLSTLYFLISQLVDRSTWMDDLLSGFLSGARETSDEAEIPSIMTWFINNFAYATLLLIPVFSFASYLSFFRSGINYLEHIILNAFITGQQAIIYAVFALLRTFSDNEIIEMLPVLLSFGYTLWAYWQFFKKGNRFVNILRSMFTYVLYLIVSFVTLIIATSISKAIE